MKRPLTASVLLLAVLGWAEATSAARRSPIFEVRDPFGDDHGNGALVYPSARSDLRPGDLDLLRFGVFREGPDYVFEAEFAQRIRPPEREAIDPIGTTLDKVARLGFYTFHLEIYIDTDRETGSGEQAMLPGRQAQVSPEHAWEKVVALTPQPHLLRSSIERLRLREWKESESKRRALLPGEARRRRRQISEELDPLLYLPDRVRVLGRTLRAWVPAAFFGAEPSPSWAYVVVVTGAQLHTRLGVPFFGRFPREYADGLVLPIVPGGDRVAFGGGNPDDPLQPPLVDILVPAGAERTQEQILFDYSSARGERVRVPGVVPAEIAAPPRRPSEE